MSSQFSQTFTNSYWFGMLKLIGRPKFTTVGYFGIPKCFGVPNVFSVVKTDSPDFGIPKVFDMPIQFIAVNTNFS